MKLSVDGAGGAVESSGEVLSPGLGVANGLGAAFELKFQLELQEANRIEAWARQHLTPDPHGDGGRYRITSVYCDTPNFDVFQRTPGFRRTKFRFRRYDNSPNAFLERKTKRGDRVRKRRAEIAAEELALLSRADAPPPAGWVGDWFHQRVRDRRLQPTCCVTYERAAFFGVGGSTPIRLTIDRDVLGVANSDWQIPRLSSGHDLLPGQVVLELKFHLQLPDLFRELLALLPGQLSRASKYRRCVELCGLWTPPPVDESPALESPAIETATLESPTIASAVSPGSPEGA